MAQAAMAEPPVTEPTITKPAITKPAIAKPAAVGGRLQIARSTLLVLLRGVHVRGSAYLRRHT
jgi:hypothetical protein